MNNSISIIRDIYYARGHLTLNNEHFQSSKSRSRNAALAPICGSSWGKRQSRSTIIGSLHGHSLTANVLFLRKSIHDIY